MAAAIPKSTALASAKAQMILPAEMTSFPAALSLSVQGKDGLPRFSGLRIQQQSKRSLGLALLDSKRGSWVSRRAGEGKGVVCEAQETALDGQFTFSPFSSSSATSRTWKAWWNFGFAL